MYFHKLRESGNSYSSESAFPKSRISMVHKYLCRNLESTLAEGRIEKRSKEATIPVFKMKSDFSWARG